MKTDPDPADLASAEDVEYLEQTLPDVMTDLMSLFRDALDTRRISASIQFEMLQMLTGCDVDGAVPASFDRKQFWIAYHNLEYAIKETGYAPRPSWAYTRAIYNRLAKEGASSSVRGTAQTGSALSGLLKSMHSHNYQSSREQMPY